MNQIHTAFLTQRRKKRRTYQPRVFGGRLIMPDEIERDFARRELVVTNDEQGPGGATAGDDRKMNNEPLEREPMNNEVRAAILALLEAKRLPVETGTPISL
jgi:hypothetical protein